jgi:hypothetical protein
LVTELTIPILPCRMLDDVLFFYEALGFQVTYGKHGQIRTPSSAVRTSSARVIAEDDLATAAEIERDLT